MRTKINCFIFISFNLFVISLFSQPIQISYFSSFSQIESMLSNNTPDFKKAVFLTENAFLENQLSEKKFENTIEYFASICRGITASGNIVYPENNKDIARVQCAVFLFETPPLKNTQ